MATRTAQKKSGGSHKSSVKRSNGKPTIAIMNGPANGQRKLKLPKAEYEAIKAISEAPEGKKQQMVAVPSEHRAAITKLHRSNPKWFGEVEFGVIKRGRYAGQKTVEMVALTVGPEHFEPGGLRRPREPRAAVVAGKAGTRAAGPQVSFEALCAFTDDLQEFVERDSAKALADSDNQIASLRDQIAKLSPEQITGGELGQLQRAVQERANATKLAVQSALRGMENDGKYPQALIALLKDPAAEPSTP